MLYVNYIYTDNDRLIIDGDQHFLTQIYSRPREEEKKFDLSAYLNKKNYSWNLEMSIFKNYQPDNEALIDECFEFDFKSSKIIRLVKDQEADDVRETLRDIYPLLFHSYKYYASGNLSANVKKELFIGFRSRAFQPMLSLILSIPPK
jgi:hypothetical protein